MVTSWLAQSLPAGRLVLLIGLAIVALLAAGVAVVQLRRRLFGSHTADSGFDLETLQRQLRAGEITEAEFRTLRRALLGLPPEPSGSEDP